MTNTPAAIPTLAANYEPAKIEKKWYPLWETQGYFQPSGHGTPYCIMIPPPNVTGSLHMGHGFNNTIMDALIRYARMSGKNTLWQPGTDHAGIATQMVVERQLNGQGITRHDLGREAFIDKVWQWKQQSGNTITQQIRRLGSSVDWSRERFTMDDGLSRAVKEVFIRLYDQGLIYKRKRLVNWDPKLHTALSDLEVENHETSSSLWHFRYYFADPSIKTSTGLNYIVVATTRPETLLGDTAVAVNPNDPRYNKLIGQQLKLPISGRTVPIIADDYVDIAFGSGCVKITPAHDFNDFELGQRHNLPLINLFDKNAVLLAEFEYMTAADKPISQLIAAPTRYAGLERFSARKLLLSEAQQEDWLDKVESYTLKAPTGDRSGVIVEPWLTDQWYLSMQALATPAIDAVETGKIKFVPEQYKNMYMAWMTQLQDWCISRQLWWGHRIPAWYDQTGRVYVGHDEQTIRQKHQLADTVMLTQDSDVLDTWFSSALWTFSTLGWPEQTLELKQFHSTDVLVTGFDIIFFWVARMIMMTMYFIKNDDGSPQIPFKTVYVHGLVRDAEGQKMSKSKGNVLDPIDLIDGIELSQLVQKRTMGMMNPKDAHKIEKATIKEFPNGIPAFGTDALRFTFCALASTGRDIKFDLKRVEGYRNFCTKIWNATRFVLLQCTQDGYVKAINTTAQPQHWELPEQWIISRLQRCEQTVAEAFAHYRLDLAANAIYEFIWTEYCDWYLELTKSALQNANTNSERCAEIRRVLLSVLETCLRLIHPLMPFISEEIWQIISPLLARNTTLSVMLASYPIAQAEKINTTAEADMQWLQALITAVRNIRGETKLSNQITVDVLIQNATAEQRAQLQRIESLFKSLAKVDKLSILAQEEESPLSASNTIGDVIIHVPLAGLIDPKIELQRLEKESIKLQTQITQLKQKLGNANFVDKAPADLVVTEQEKLTQAASQEALVQRQIQQLRQP